MSLKLSELVDLSDYRVICGDTDISVTTVTTDSRTVSDSGLFIAVIGVDNDGHKYLPSAIEKGASCVVVDSRRAMFSDEEIIALAGNKVTVIESNDTSEKAALIYANYLGNPQKNIEFIGVTGTKGKTTATFMLYDIFTRSNMKSALLGTVCNYVDGKRKETTNTTLPMPQFYNIVKEISDCKTEECVMEVSSHGLKQNRVFGVNYKVACFTNFFRDHIGPKDHPTMEDYFMSKMKIFDVSEYAVINTDCTNANEAIAYAKNAGCKVVTYGLKSEADCMALSIERAMVNGAQGSMFMLKSPWYDGEVEVGMLGEFNVYNALLAISVAGVLGIDFNVVKESLSNVRVPGRVQPVVNNHGFSCLVDYAHNEGSLESVLKALRPYVDGRIITVFGCGGDRSHERRFGMGRVAGNNSDYTVITSDNPRTEEPEAIINMIVTGISETSGKYEIEINRKTAIEKAVRMAKPGDLVLVAGKGHEDYQEVNGVKAHFDDYEVASDAIANLEV